MLKQIVHNIGTKIKEHRRDKAVYNELFRVNDSEREGLAKLIRDAHGQIKKYTSFRYIVPRSYIEKDYDSYRESKVTWSSAWPDNSFLIAEEIVLYSPTARQLDPLTIAAIACTGIERIAGAGAGVFSGAAQEEIRNRNWEHIKSWNPKVIYASLATQGILQPEDFHMSDSDLEWKARNYFYSQGKGQPEIDMKHRTPELQRFVDLYWKVIGEVNKAQTRIYDRLEGEYGSGFVFDKKREFALQRRKSLRLI